MMIVLSVCVVLLTVLLLTRPLWQRQLPAVTWQLASAPSVHTQENVEAYRARLKELEMSVAAGRITAIEKQNLEIELKRTLLTDVPSSGAAVTDAMRVDTGPQWQLLAGVVLLLLLITAGGYGYFGDYQQARDWQQTQLRLQPKIDQALADPQVLLELFKVETTRDVILSYQQSLLRHPENPMAWQALSRILQSLEQNNMALQAARKAYQQDQQEPIYALELAQLIIESNQGKLTPESEHVLKGLQKDHPQDPRALMLLGTLHFKQANWSPALNAFQALQTQLQNVDMGEDALLVQQKIADYITQSQQNLAAAQASATAPALSLSSGNLTATAPQSSTPTLEKTEVEKTAAETTAANTVNLRVRVSIAPAAMSSWKGSETLWVFAKAVDGPRFPVAAKKMRPTQWPVEITLSDLDAMMPQFKLSGFAQVNITARLSAHDSVMASQPEDWQQTVNHVDPRQAQPVALMLDVPKL